MSQKREDYELNATIARHLGYAPDPTDTRPPQRCTWQRGERGTPGAASHWPGPLPYTERLDLVAQACDHMGWDWTVDGNVSFEDPTRRYRGTVFRPGDGPCFIHGDFSIRPARALTLALVAALEAHACDTKEHCYPQRAVADETPATAEVEPIPSPDPSDEDVHALMAHHERLAAAAWQETQDAPGLAGVLELFAQVIETHRERQKCGVFLGDLAEQLSPAYIRSLIR